jgi:hypothetical protein
MFSSFTSVGLMPHVSSANMVWKCVVETNGTAIFLPRKSVGGDASAVARHHGFRFIDVVDDPEQLQVDAPADGGRQGAGTDDADLHVAGRHAGGHLAPDRTCAS